MTAHRSAQSSSSTRVRTPVRAAAAERGSVLLMVVAVLALMAIIGVAYTTLGRADRTASAALVRSARIDDHASLIADYLSSVIADDVLSTYAERTGAGAGPDEWIIRREATDYPGASDWLVSDVSLLGTGAARFNPRGSYAGAWTGGGTDPRSPSDPWLAPIEPEYIVPAGMPLPARSITLADFAEPPSWRTISNFAPDGRFVNFFNLRGNFNVKPGILAGQMSDGLSMLDDNDAPTNVNTITGITVSTAAERNNPANLTNNQYRAFRAMVDDLLPSNADHVNNQWADTDADGFADARWIELVDAFDPMLPRWVLPQSGRHRLFVAVRATDNSGRINVNTAGDFLYEPDATTNPSGQAVHSPAGLTPADIDLRRFLTTYDMSYQFGGGTTWFGYPSFEQPTAGTPADYTAYLDQDAIDTGKTSYAALRRAIDSGAVLPGDAVNPGEPLLAWNASEGTPNPLNPTPLDSAARARLYDGFGADPSSARMAATGNSRLYRAPFGMPDELELRVFGNVNDSDHFSTLERTMGGREDANRNFGVLRENRSRSVEMQGRTVSGGVATPNSILSAFADIRHLLTTTSGARPIMDSPLTSTPAGVNPAALSALEIKTDGIALIRAVDNSLGAGPRPGVVEIQEVFDFYANALMPYTEETNYPDAWSFTSVPASKGLSYGESVELSARVAAHMAANLIDAVDTDSVGTYDRAEPTRIALELVTNAPTHMDFEPVNIVGLKDERRPDVGAGLHRGSPRLNIYGIEAQPFIIEVGWFGTFTDTPFNAPLPGDNDFVANQTPPIPPQTEPTPGPITIDDTVDPTNADFMFEVLAFQLTNPFDRDLLISTGGEVSYYIEYFNRFFALAERTSDGSAISGDDVVIPAFGTMVFYVANIKDPQDLATRLIDARYAPPGGPTPAAIVRDHVEVWARRQFGADSVPIAMVHQKSFTVCDSAAGPGGGGAEFIDLFAETTVPGSGAGDAPQPPIGVPPTSAEQRKVACLWRVSRPVSPTDPAGDILLDRIHDARNSSNGMIWDYRQRRGAPNVVNSLAGDDSDGNLTNDLDNTGFSLTKWAGFRRPTDVNSDRGSMPAWCIEAKSINLYNPANAMPLNIAFNEPPGGIGDGDNYRRNVEAERRSTLDGLLTAQLTTSTINDQILEKAEDKTGNAIPMNKSVPAKPFEQVAVQVHLSGNRTNPQLFSRAGDFLLPLGIGPSYDPLRMALPTRAEGLEKSWMTLAEALALSSDYYSPTSVEDPVLHLLGHRDSVSVPPFRPRLDRGNVVLNDFSPYIDIDNSGAFELANDEPIGRGVPLAFNIVDSINTTDRFIPDPNPAALPVLRTRAHGGPLDMIRGTLNINSTPASVFRMVPMLSPDPWNDTVDPLNSNSWLSKIVPPATTPLFNRTTERFDIAATAVGYRDKATLHSRPLAAPAFGAPERMDFRDTNDAANPDVDGRFNATRIAAIREQPGFKSVGEIMALRYHDPVSGVRNYDNSIDRFADGTSATPPRQPSTALEATLIPNIAGTLLETDEIPNDYDEQLAIASAAMNCITVRSDVFCVWFLIHGYQPSDVENLAPADPMIPSIARRYVMVVDRSNVTQLGQKPKVLMFQEVPIR